MNYGELISEAFWISWRNKFLWVFGLFVFSAPSLNYPTNSSGAPPGGPGNEPPAWLEGLGRWILENRTHDRGRRRASSAA